MPARTPRAQCGTLSHEPEAEALDCAAALRKLRSASRPCGRALLALLAATCAVGGAGGAHAQEKSRVAVLDFVERSGVDPGIGSLVADLVRAELYAAGDVDLVEREQLDKVLREQKLQASGLCDSTTCSVQVGQLLGVPFVWSGNVGKLGSRYLLTIQVVNVTTAEVDRLTRVQATSLDDLADRTIRATQDLIAGDPLRAAAFVREGRTLYREGKYAEAVDRFAQATTLNPRDGQAWQWYAQALQKVGRTEEAVEAQRRGEALGPRPSVTPDRPPAPGSTPVQTAPPTSPWLGIAVRHVSPWWQPSEAQQQLAQSRDLALAFENGQGQQFVLIPPGAFRMGSPNADPRSDFDEWPPRSVNLTHAFYLGATEVTNGQFRRYQATHDSGKYKGVSLNDDDQPVVRVNWNDAQGYCSWLTTTERQTGRLPATWAYRLPTEAEWEYACRAGTQGLFSFGDDSRDLWDHGWYDENAENRTQPVGRLYPNPWGLFDIHGNVWEWCEDWYSLSYAGAAQEDPHGPGRGMQRVLRGGSWRNSRRNCRSANRNQSDPVLADSYHFGFRLALSSSS